MIIGRATAIAIALISMLALTAGCGGDSAPKVPGGGDEGDVEVIAAWSDALRAGKVDEAATYFRLPSLVENGTPPIELRSHDDAIAFNRSLPCGARLVKATNSGRFTTAFFVLTDRPGGDCGSGIGLTARTNFVIDDGKISEWRRLPNETAPPEGEVI